VAIEGIGFGSLFRPLFRGLGIAASGLAAQRQRIEVIAHNVANAETTRTADGGPYRRRVVQFEAAPFRVGGAAGPMPGAVGDGGAVVPGPGGVVVPGPGGAGIAGAPGITPFPVPEVKPPEVLVPGAAEWTEPAGGVRVAGVVEDASEGPLVYDPGHPDADEAGYVRYPNVRITDEMVDLMEARRVYEANATVFQAVKAMLKRAIDI